MRWIRGSRASGWLVIALGLTVGALGGAAAEPPSADQFEQALTVLKTAPPEGSRLCRGTIEARRLAVRSDATQRADFARRLAELLAGDATAEAKDFACRQLSLVGSAEAVPALLPLLADPALSHLARYALERIPDPAAGLALRQAVSTVPEALKVGVIGSLGARRDAGAVPVLRALLQSSESAVATAAAHALGRIGDVPAAEALAGCQAAQAELRAAIEHGLVSAADRLRAAGDTEAACRFYRRLSEVATLPAARAASFRGLVLTAPAEAPALVAAALADDDPSRRAAAARLVVETPDPALALALAAKVGEARPEAQVLLLDAFAERRDPRLHGAVLGALDSPNEGVRLAATSALRSLGTAEDVPRLAELAASGRSEAKAAAAALAGVPADGTDGAIVAMLARQPHTGVAVLLLRALGERYATDATACLLEHMTAADPAVRRTAIEALGKVLDAGQAAVLVNVIREAAEAQDRAAAEQAMAAVCGRWGTACATPVLGGLDGAAVPARCALLRLLRRAGGDPALDAVLAAAREPDEEVRTTAIRELSEWGNERAAGDLLELATRSDDLKLHVLALRGYIKAVGAGRRKDQDKVADLGRALAATRRVEERRQVFAEAGRIQALPALRFVQGHLTDEGTTEETAAAVVSIAAGLKVADADRAAVLAAVEAAAKATADERTRKSAEDIARKLRK